MSVGGFTIPAGTTHWPTLSDTTVDTATGTTTADTDTKADAAVDTDVAQKPEATPDYLHILDADELLAEFALQTADPVW